ncbi:hypothetical protein PAEPH01_2681 [Pancytospora epiphaga]|nr:hypothetical protein PAEPH01_2681 [Pancytospora epiphaga]
MKGESYQLCIDYKELNKITVKETVPLPPIEEISKRSTSARTFLKIDTKNGYYQARSSPNCEEYTAFTAHFIGFWFRRMPLGYATL